MGKGEEEKISTLNRILSLFLINVILISLFAPYSTVFASAEDGKVDMKILTTSTDQTVISGNTYVMQVQLDYVPTGINLINFDFNYDKSVFELNYNDDDGEYDYSGKQSWNFSADSDENPTGGTLTRTELYSTLQKTIFTFTLKAIANANSSDVTINVNDIAGGATITYDANVTACKVGTNLGSHTVTYDYTTNGGTSSTLENASVIENSAIDLSATATKEGYNFVGWNTDSTAKTGLDSLNMSSNDITLYAIFSKEITTTFKYYNGTSETQENVIGTMYNNDADVTIQTPMGKAYTDAEGNTWTKNGWTKELGATIAAGTTENTDIAVNADSTYYMLYKRNITLNYNVNGGSSIAPTNGQGVVGTNSADPTTILGSNIMVDSSTPVKTGYTFAGWNTKQNGTGNTITGMQNFTKDTVLYANWTPNTNTIYTVEHYKEQEDGSYVKADTDTLTGTTDTQVTAGAKTSYTGYTLDTNVEGTLTGGTIQGDGSLVLKLYYKLNEYTVTFKNDNGTLIDTKTVKYGGSATIENPTKEADAQYTYTFEKWVDNTGADVDLNNITSNMEVFAKYTKESNKYTITFYDEDGVSKLGESTVDYGNNATAPVTPTKAEDNTYTYVFEKWVTEVSGEIEDNLSNVTANRNVYAKYTANYKEYNIKFVNDNGDSISSKTDYHYGDLLVLPENPTKEATAEYTYKFAGWSEDGINVIDLNTATVSENKTYKAVYTEEKNKYTITFYDEDGVAKLGESTVKYGETAVYPNSLPTKASTDGHTYAFEKWVTTVGGTTEDNLSNVIANRNVYASYSDTVAKYTVRFFNEGTQIGADQTIEHGNSAVKPENPTKEADAQYTYTFEKWVDNTGADVNLDQVTKDIDAYAKYTTTTNKYTVRFFDENGTQIGESQSIEYGTSATAPTPTKEATAQYTYNFTGWVDQIGGTTTVDVTNITGNVDAYAKFDQITNKYTITFYDEDGVAKLGESTVDYGNSAVAPETPTKAEDNTYTYTFEKWVTEVSGETEDNLSNVIANRNVYAKYTANYKEYKIEFVNDNGDSISSKADYHYGEFIILPGNPTKEATAEYTYTFAGWSEDGENVIDLRTATVSENKTYKAVYTKEKNKYTVNFYNEDKTTLLESKTVEYGSSATTENPTKEATAQYTYTFEKWLNKADDTDANLSNITENIDVYAKYTETINKYTITFYDEDGITKLGESTVDYGSNATAPVTPTKTGIGHIYTFEKWVTEVNGEIEDDLSNVIANRNVYATYKDELATYTVTFDVNGGNELETNKKEVKYSNEYGTLPTPTKEGYTFVGWYDKKIDGNKIEETTKVTATKNHVLYAIWKINVYDVEFIGKNENGEEATLATVKVEHGNNITTALLEAQGININEIQKDVITPEYTYKYKEMETSKFYTVTENRKVNIIYETVKNKYKITFYNDDKTTVLGDSEVEYGENADDTYINPVKAEDETYTYTFIGWTNEDGNTDNLNNVTENRNVYAKYAPVYKEYSIKFVNEDGSLVEEKTDYHYGDNIVLPTEPTKDADAEYTYTFAGWTDNNGEIVDLNDITVTENTTFTAKYDKTKNKYKITFYNDDKTEILGESEVEYGENADSSSIVHTKNDENGYSFTFEKWVNEDGEDDDLSNVIANRNVYAKYTKTPITYNIEYVDTFGADNSKNPTTYTVEDAEITLEPLESKIGMTFKGWYTNTDYTDKVESIITSKMENIKVYAKWDIEKLMYFVKVDATVDNADPSVKIYDNFDEAKEYVDNLFDNGNGTALGIYDLNDDLVYFPEVEPKLYYITDENDQKLNLEYNDFDEAKSYVDGKFAEGTTLKVYDQDDKLVYMPKDETPKIQYFVKVNKEDENTNSNTFTNFNDAKKEADNSNLRGIKVYDINGDIVYEPDNLYLKSQAYKIGTNNSDEKLDEYVEGDLYLYRVSPETTFKKFIENCDTNGTITVYKQDGTVLGEDELIGTGMTLKDEKGSKIISIKISVLGDINGNGKIEGEDLTGLRGDLYEDIKLKDEYLLAMDINDNNTIEGEDLTKIRGVLYEDLSL